MTNLAQNLLAARKEKGYTQGELGKLLQVTQRCYASWEQGRTEPNIELLSKLADIFDCSVDYLIGRTNDIGIIETNNELTNFEKAFLQLLNTLSETDKYQVLGFARSLAT